MARKEAVVPNDTKLKEQLDDIGAGDHGAAALSVRLG
jgi:hypothetical protein